MSTAKEAWWAASLCEAANKQSESITKEIIDLYENFYGLYLKLSKTEVEKYWHVVYTKDRPHRDKLNNRPIWY